MYESILVPLDGSERSEQILPHAAELAEKFGTKLLLLQVITPIYHMESLERPGYAQVILEDVREMKTSASTYLKSHKLRLNEQGIGAEFRVVEGQPVEAILAVADEANVDMIAMSSHGRTGLPRVFYGSVAAGILHGTNRPLLLIRSELH